MEIVELISQYGFPIIMCLILLKRINEDTEYRNAEYSRLIEVIDRNSEAINELKTEIGGKKRNESNGTNGAS